VSRKIKAVIAKNWYCFFAIIFSFARSCNNENNVVDSYRMASWHCSSVWTGLEGKQTERTEPKLIGLNRFSVRFGSKTKKKKWFGCLFWSKIGPNRKCSALVQIVCILPLSLYSNFLHLIKQATKLSNHASFGTVPSLNLKYLFSTPDLCLEID